MLFFYKYNRRLYSQGGLAGNDRGFEQSIFASQGHVMHNTSSSVG